MRLYFRNLIILSFFLFCFHFSAFHVFAATTLFRSAGTVTTDGAIPYTNIGNCNATDGLTCDRAPGPLFANLYFSNFGSFHDFGMPDKSTITKMYMRVTGKSNVGFYGGSINGGRNCDFFTTIYTFMGLIGPTLRTQTIANPVNSTGLNPSVSSFCYTQANYESGRTTIRLNYSSSVGINWSANIDNFEIAFDYTAPATPSAKTPLILIPGIGGSELKVNSDTLWSESDGHGGVFTHLYPKDEKIWVNTTEALKPGNDDYFDVLRMNQDGTSKADIGLTGNLFSLYQDTINFFVADGYELNKTLFVFPYDWRKDIADTAPFLDEKIAAIKQQTGAQKVDIVAHSMGGLVARNYISDPQRAENVRKLFNLGAPHLGAVTSLRSLLYGSCLYLEFGPLCPVLSISEVKDTVQNMIGAYELVPATKYFDFYTDHDFSHPYPYRNDSGALDYEQIGSFLSTNGQNTSLFTPSEAFHTLDSSLQITNGVDVTNIAGSGMPTLGQIVDTTLIDFSGIKIPHKDAIMINGDKTVPLYSASLSDTLRNISLLGNAKTYYTKQNHTGLVSSGPALNLIANRLNGDVQLPPGAGAQPFQFSGHLLSVHSPVNLHVYDSAGNHTGPTDDGDFEEQVPGSTYDTIDDAKFIYLPDDGAYVVRFDSLGTGKFDFKIRTYHDDENIDTKIYKDLPLLPTTHGETTFDTSIEESPIVKLDHNYDGIVDQQVGITSEITGEQIADFTPPSTEVILEGNKGNNGWFKGNVQVRVVGKDDSSGVLRTEYSLDGGEVQAYSSQFVISNEGAHTLKVRSIDNAGNEEDVHEYQIKIDTIPPEAKVFVDPTSRQIVVEGIDANPAEVEEIRGDNDNDRFLVMDEAGNSLKILLNFFDKNNVASFSVNSLQYNKGEEILLGANKYSIIYEGEKEPVNIKVEKFEIQGEEKIKILYDARKNMSSIYVKDNSGREKEIQNGLRVLQEITKSGEVSYVF